MEQKFRQLAAVMFTDIKGFTSLMQKDEEKASVLLEKHRKIFEKVTQENHGEIIQYFGDGTLSKFSSAVEAVHCAIKLQKQWREARIDVRIGIHMGDIIVYENKDVIGDSVNVASRIQSIGVPGSVLISDKVVEEIRNHQGIKVRKLGKFSLKNVTYVPDLYAIDNNDLVVPSRGEISGKSHSRVLKSKLLLFSIFSIILALLAVKFIIDLRSDQTSTPGDGYVHVAVLPFQNLNSPSEGDFLRTGLTEELITKLGRLEGIRVMSGRSTRNLSVASNTISELGALLGVAYIIDGNIQYFKENLKINISLVEVKSEINLWSQVFDGSLEDIYQIQTFVTSMVAEELDAPFLVSRGTLLIDTLTYKYYLKGVFLLSESREDEALLEFEKVLALEKSNEAALYKLLETKLKLIVASGDAEKLTDMSEQIEYYSSIASRPADVNYILAWGKYIIGDSEQALVLLSGIEDQYHSLPEYYLLRAKVHEALGDTDSFESDLLIVYELDPSPYQ